MQINENFCDFCIIFLFFQSNSTHFQQFLMFFCSLENMVALKRAVGFFVSSVKRWTDQWTREPVVIF
jgi:hypothetical protein